MSVIITVRAMNEVINNIITRRSVRTFKADQIPNEILTAVLDAGTYAPLGSFAARPPYKITAVNNKEKVSWVNDRTNEALRAIVVDEQTNPLLLPPIKRAKGGASQFLFEAPAFVFLTNRVYENAIADCSCVIQNIMLAAHSLGLASCWVNLFSRLNDSAVIKDMFAALNIPPEHHAFGCIAMGYPAGQIPAPPQRAEGLFEIIE